MSTVPNRREALRLSQKIERGGGSLDPRSVRREALAAAEARALDAIRCDSDSLAEWCELAAANTALSARALLEAQGQGARGMLRPLSFWRRNGYRILKGSRAYPLSAFGGNFFGPDSLAPGRERPRIVGADERPLVEAAAALAESCDGDPIATAVLLAQSGYRLRAEWSEPEPFTDEAPVMLRPPVVSFDTSTITLERLQDALPRVRAAMARVDHCLSCHGAGCALCSLDEGKARAPAAAKPKPVKPRPVPAVRPAPTPSVRVQATAPARKRRERPSEPHAAIVAAYAEAERLRAEARRLDLEANAAISRGIVRAQADGQSLGDIAASLGVSVQRVSVLSKRMEAK